MPEKIESNLRGELEFLCYLHKRNYPATIPVAAHSGDLIVSFDSAWGKYYASVFETAAGICIEDTDCNDQILFAYGRALGILHTLSSEYFPENKKWTYQEVLLWIEQVLKEYHAPDKMRAELDEVRQLLNELPQTKDTFGLVHYDFEPDNIFWDEISRRCTAIDFEDGMYHFFLVDVEQALDALMESIPENRQSVAKNVFLQGYQSAKALESSYAEKLKLMRRFCNLYSYARLIRCIDEQHPNEPDWMVELRKKLYLKIEHLENGICSVVTAPYL